MCIKCKCKTGRRASNAIHFNLVEENSYSTTKRKKKFINIYRYHINQSESCIQVSTLNQGA